MTHQRTTSKRVELQIPAEFGGHAAEVVGEFTSWVPLAMSRDTTGRFSLVMYLPPGRQWRYRFLLDGRRWVNDPDATEFHPSADGGYCSILNT